jgi:thiosulfate reductase/polysulfide reductase chain A
MKSFATTCHGCHNMCPCLAHVEEGKVVKVTGHPDAPLNIGFPKGAPNVPFMCEKGRRAEIALMYHPNRLLHPIKRIGARGEGKWAQISWEEALTTIEKKLIEVKEKYGPESICGNSHGANYRECQLMLSLFLRGLGTPNIVENNDICAGAGEVADFVTIGEDLIRPWRGPLDIRNSKCLLIMGANLAVSHPARWRDVLDAQRNGAKLIVIDPRRVEMGQKADIYVKIRPGTDGMLALAMLQVIINEKLIDSEFIDRWCLGFEQLRDHVQDYTPERAEKVTDVDANLIREVARQFATTKPACIIAGEGKEQQISAVQTHRSLICMLAITGNIDKPGTNTRVRLTKGFKQMRSYLWKSKEFNLPEDVERKRIGAAQFPLWSYEMESVKQSHYPSVIKAMVYGDPYWIKFFWVETNNPVVNRPNSKEIIKGLRNLDFLVVSDFQITPTGELADIILPQAMTFEYDEITFVPSARAVQIRQMIVPPPGEARYLTDVVLDLKKRMAEKGLIETKYIPWNTKAEFFEFLLQGTNYTFEDLKETGFAAAMEPNFEMGNIKTPSGKIELWSSILAKNGSSPLPTWRPSPDTERPELMEKFPLLLISGTREWIYNESRYHELPFATKVHPDPLAEMHPNVANARNIKDGDWVWIVGVTGRCKMRAKVTENIHPDAVNVPVGWWFPDRKGFDEKLESSVNMILPSDPPYDTVMGAPITKAIACEVVKIS